VFTRKVAGSSAPGSTVSSAALTFNLSGAWFCGSPQVFWLTRFADPLRRGSSCRLHWRMA